jgi:hypothetical protein
MKLSDDDLRTPQMKIATNRIRGMVDLALEKIALHHQNPGQHPLPADPRSVERALHNLFVKLPDRRQKKLLDKANETLKLNATQRAQHYGELKAVNLRSSATIAEQIKALPIPAAFKFTPAEVDYYTNKLKAMADKPTKAAPRTRQVAAPEISFVVDTLTCKKKTEVSKDEISLAGFAADNFGNSLNVAPFFVGQFKKGQTISLGDKGKLFTFKQDVGAFPITFTANIFLVETDLLHNQDLVNALSIVLQALGLAALTVIMVLAVAGAAIPVVIVLILFGTGLVSGILATSVIPLLADDFSILASDSLTVLSALAPGVAFDRSLDINGLTSGLAGLFPGEYTATGRWVAE